MPVAALVVGTVISAVASKKAAKKQVQSGDAAIDEQRRQYDQTREDQQPWLTAGQNALGQLADPQANFQASTDYGFRRSEGNRDIQSSFAARGGAASGNALRALTEFNSQLAAGEFGSWWNRQAGLAGVGQDSASTLGVLGQRSADNIGSIQIGQGNARATGIAGVGNALINAGDQYTGILESQRKRRGKVGTNPYGGYN